MAASCRAAGAVLLIASLLVVVALSGADARPSVYPDKTAVAPSSDDANGLGYVAGAAAALDDGLAKPDCDDDGDEGGGDDDGVTKHHHKHKHVHYHFDNGDQDDGLRLTGDQTKGSGSDDSGDELPNPQTGDSGTGTNSEELELDQELCSDCEEPKKPAPEPPCNTCEEPKKTCNKVRAVQEGETCYSMGQCAGLGQDDFLRFNPNLCCDNLFVGQWVCLDATCAD